METLDISWFDKQEKIEKIYDRFYLSDIENLGVTFIYIDNKDEVCVIKNELVKITDSILTRGTLVNLIRENRKLNNIQYSLYALLRFKFYIIFRVST